MRRTEGGVAVVRIHYTADPDMTPERVALERAKYTSTAWWDLEMEINYDALSGQRVYPEFDPIIHVVADKLVPKLGCRYMAIDPHPRTPHAFLWLLVDRWGDWWIYRELWPSVVAGRPTNLRPDQQENTFTVREYAETVCYLEHNELEYHNEGTDDEYALYRRTDKGENIIYRFMDQAGKGFRASDESGLLENYAKRYDRFGIQCVDPQKSHRTGEDAIHALMRCRWHDQFGMWPRLHIAQSCRELTLELMKHRYPMQRINPEKELKQDPIEARRHLVDNLRYLATGHLTYIQTLES
jgi:hypothetical protein